MGRVGIIGAGSWGTALANLLGTKGQAVAIWGRDEGLLANMKAGRENKKYLPGVKLSENIEIADTLESVVGGVDFVITAVPAQQHRSVMTAAVGYMRPDAVVINVAKGIERGSMQTISMIVKEVSPDIRYAVLSGPSHAEEVGQFLPTTVAVASECPDVADSVQELFITDRFRVYTNEDVLGLELGGSLKNVIALAAGVSEGMGFGDNTKAALMTRGMVEMIRLGTAMGAKSETFEGLSGIGDLIVTCTSRHSRNRRCGVMIGEGIPPEEAQAKVGMVVEGILTVDAVKGLMDKHGVEMPISLALYRVVKGELGVQEALEQLMTRPRKHEKEELPQIGIV
ncbi:MAG: NAD(P)-dependent glycerol-3-phosphate dehydrogenase [Clostridiales Family XIII bacterium]|jgi:glycerol-3-phosphate dehydrogenase (NAD(P)+)|nr:NAD(P)-dependent glycerol-3-phosphate dehydrogenase [Clostridiales Family XIII bacterium]